MPPGSGYVPPSSGYVPPGSGYVPPALAVAGECRPAGTGGLTDVREAADVREAIAAALGG